MNSSRFSNVALALLVIAVVAVAPVAAVSVTGEDVPDAIEVGQTQDVTFTATDLYTNYDTWTLEAHTELTQATWTVTTYDVGGAQVDQTQYNAQNFSHTIAKDDGVAEVEVRLQGTVPEVTQWSYDPPQSIILASFQEAQQGGTSSSLESYSARPYTEDSQAARTAIDDARTAIDDASGAGVDVSEAESDVESAVSSYDNGNFGNAERLAGDAQETAESAMASSQRTDTLLMVGAGVVVLLILLGIGYWYLSQRDSYDKLG